MGPVLAPVTQAIIRLTQAPAGIVANSILATASLAIQALADVRIPGTERAHPLTLYMMSIAESGERKTTADREASIGVRNREKELREEAEVEGICYRNACDAYEAARAYVLKKHKGESEATRRALDALGGAPKKPKLPIVLVTEPTVEGLVKLLADSQPTIGLFCSEGGAFIGGHSMSDEARLRSAARLSSLWDGEPIDRIRSGDGSTVIVGSRVAMHIMAQPEAAARFLSDPTLRDQGLLSRFLISAPAPTAGTRMFRTVDLATQQTVLHFAEEIVAILREVAPANESSRRVLRLDPEARAGFIRWHDEVERAMAPGGPLTPIKGFASKLAEHAARVAGVLTLIVDAAATTIGATAMACGIELANYYAGEMLRLAAEAQVSRELRRAERLRVWLDERDAHLIHISEVYQFGPAEFRSKADALAAIRILEDHGHLVRIGGGAEVGGRWRRDVWRFVRGEVAECVSNDVGIRESANGRT